MRAAETLPFRHLELINANFLYFPHVSVGTPLCVCAVTKTDHKENLFSNNFTPEFVAFIQPAIVPETRDGVCLMFVKLVEISLCECRVGAAGLETVNCLPIVSIQSQIPGIGN